MSSIKGFPERLKAARLASGQTQEQLGFAVDVTKSSVSAWENGREMPSLRNLPKLRVVLDCSLDYLVCGEGKVQEQENSKTTSSAQSPQEVALLRHYRKLSDKQRRSLLDLMKSS